MRNASGQTHCPCRWTGVHAASQWAQLYPRIVDDRAKNCFWLFAVVCMGAPCPTCRVGAFAGMGGGWPTVHARRYAMLGWAGLARYSLRSGSGSQAMPASARSAASAAAAFFIFSSGTAASADTASVTTATMRSLDTCLK